MRILDLARRPLVMTEWRARSPLESDYDELVRGPFQLWSDGTLQIVYLELADDPWAAPYLDAMDTALARMSFSPTARTGGLKTLSRIFGYRPRVKLRHDYCSAAALAGEAPTEHAALAGGAHVVARFYAEHNPRLAARHQALTEKKVLPDWRLEGSAYTSGIANRNNPLKYHFDRGNFVGVWSGMLAFKQRIAGGYLSLPEFGIAAEILDRSLFLFDGQDILHGVTPITRLDESSLRHTVVYYSLREMWNCAPVGDELVRFRRSRTLYEARRGRE